MAVFQKLVQFPSSGYKDMNKSVLCLALWLKDSHTLGRRCKSNCSKEPSGIYSYDFHQMMEVEGHSYPGRKVCEQCSEWTITA